MGNLFWKILTSSLDHGSVIIEGAMHLHKFLVDYQDEHCDKYQEINERRIFNEDLANSDAMIMIAGNDVAGTIRNQEMNNRQRGMQLRDKLIISFMDHDMHTGRKEEWTEDKYYY